MKKLIAVGFLVLMTACGHQAAAPRTGNTDRGKVGAIFGAEAGYTGGLTAGLLENKH